MANNYLITGYWGEPHVTAENDRGFNAAVFGPGRYVLPVGEQLRAAYIGNNTVRLYDGKLLDNGALAGIAAGKYVDLLIPEAGQGMSRNDLIVFQYSKDVSTLVESGAFIVIRGTEVSGTAADPALVQDDLLTDEATLDQMALYRIPVTGATIGEPVPLFEVAKNFADSGPASVLNILDNGDWMIPVNTRGESAYRGLGYSIDCWIVPNDNAALTVGDGFVLIQNDSTTETAMFTQRLKRGTLKVGTVYTGVFCFSGGTVVCGVGVCAEGGTNLTSNEDNIYMQIAPSTDYDVFRINVKPAINGRLKYVALYEGEYAADDLPPFQSKGYGAEVANSRGAEGTIPYMDLLWENASPSSDFAAQTVSLDLSGYDRIGIDFRINAGADGFIHFEYGVGNTGDINAMNLNVSDSVMYISGRNGNITSSGVSFANCYRYPSYNTMGKFEAANGRLIPVRIYGIKGVS